MIFLSNIMLGIAYVLSSLFQFLYLLMFVYCICSWFRIDPYNPFIRWINYIADGVLRPIRRFVRPMGQLDISVIVFFLLLMFLQFALIQNLFDLAQSLRTV